MAGCSLLFPEPKVGLCTPVTVRNGRHSTKSNFVLDAHTASTQQSTKQLNKRIATMLVKNKNNDV